MISSNASSGLQQTINTDGVWRIRRRERSQVIEVFKKEESGYGDILSREFVEWRNGRDMSEADVEAAKNGLIGSINQENGRP